MALLIDGYNLLHVTGIFGRGRGSDSFQKSRQALLNFLAAALDEHDKRDAVIVFDAADAPPGLPATVQHDGISVRYARGYPDADSLLEELIAAHHAPRTLTVVSSDHRVQRAARRRKAKPVDSERWYAQRRSQRCRRGRVTRTSPQKPSEELNPEVVAYWMEQFADPPVDLAPPAKRSTTDNPELGDFENPFPPDYGDDLLGDASR